MAKAKKNTKKLPHSFVLFWSQTAGKGWLEMRTDAKDMNDLCKYQQFRESNLTHEEVSELVPFFDRQSKFYHPKDKNESGIISKRVEDVIAWIQNRNSKNSKSKDVILEI